MPDVKRKVYAYITHRNRLLVFAHPNSPEAGIQVPGGTLEAGETPEAGVLREAREETDRDDLEIVRFLGRVLRHRADIGRDEIHERFFFHLRCTGDPPETWRHGEFDPSEGEEVVIPFDFFWAPLPDGVPELIAGQGQLLPALLAEDLPRGE
ncbi:MAG TPA: NUDIX domain-containing protein [Chloroflexota bacterium]|nr:NUDIX domain-containing protein [Chloroflexota bacterium]